VPDSSKLSVIAEASVPAGRAGLADSLAEMSRLRDPDALGAAITWGAGRVLGLDAVAFVRLSPEGITCDARWARPGARPNRVGEARMAMAVEMCEDAGGTVAQRVFGRLQLVAIPVHVDGAISHVLAATARPNRVLTEAELADAAAIGAHGGACMEMMAAVTAAREYMLLEQAIAPPAGTRGDRALEQMQLVQSSSAALMGARSYSEVGQVVVNQLRTLIDYQSCRFYVLSPDGDTLEPVALLGIGTAYGDEHLADLVCAPGEGITGQAFVDGTPVRVDDAAAVPNAVQIPNTEQIDESMLVAPMVADHVPLGVITLSKQGLAGFDDDDLRLLEVIAAQAAIACENIRLIAEQRQAAEVSEALLELGAALAMQDSIDGIASMLAIAIDRLVESAAISVWRRDGDRLTPATAVGYTPREQQRLMRITLDAAADPVATALATRRISALPVEQLPALTGCLDAAPSGTTFAVVAIGERAANRGAVIVRRGPRQGRISARDEQMLLGIADQALLAITNRALVDEQQETFLATVQALGNALDLKDAYTHEHAQALVGLCTEVAERLGMSATEVRDVSFAAALHDIGKIGIPTAILNKPGPLTAEERELIETHPALGAQIIEPVEALSGAAALVLACHEHWDGSGYPLHLSGEEIPLGARVILACDAYDAMTSDRAYRKGMSPAEAIVELRRCSGTDFDPRVVDVLVAVVSAAIDAPA
jgi:HD-GYP domain-containing protein (c-di-GMP phosphodiesterase class II)/putative methionine-R-sulfoxide reductase with GAF domain